MRRVWRRSSGRARRCSSNEAPASRAPDARGDDVLRVLRRDDLRLVAAIVRPAEAGDILAPRNAPIHAVDNGTIAKLFVSKAGGNTIYQFDPDGHLCYYYAHLERYADGLHDGQTVSRGQVIGYVGTSGNAPPDTPHLHFGVFQLNADRRWWQGRALDPYEVFRRGPQSSEN